MKVEVLDDPLLASPHVYIVLGVTEVRGEAGAKVSSSKDKNFGIRGRLGL